MDTHSIAGKGLISKINPAGGQVVSRPTSGRKGYGRGIRYVHHVWTYCAERGRGGLQVVEQGQHHAWGGLTAEIGDVYV